MSKIPDFTPIPPNRQETISSARQSHSLAPRKFLQLLSESSQPIYLLDSRNRIRFANKALSSAIGVPLNELLGLECVFRISPDGHSHSDIASLLAVPPIATPSESEATVSCIPLPKGILPKENIPNDLTSEDLEERLVDGDRMVSKNWISVLVLPLDSQVAPKQKKPGKSTVRLCIWTEDSSRSVSLVESPDELTQSSDWKEQQKIQTILYQCRTQWSRLDNLTSLLGNSSVSKRLMQQVQAAISLDTNCFISGELGSETTAIAHAIFEHRRQREGRSLASVYTLPVDCRLMDRMLISEMLEMASSYAENPMTRLGDTRLAESRMGEKIKSTKVSTSLDNVRVNLLLSGIDQLALDAVEPLLRFINQNPHVAVIATALNREWKQPATGENLLAAKEEGTWNELTSAIEVMVIHIPPLSERIEDLSVLAEQIVEQLRAEFPSKKPRSIGPILRRWIQSYAWPGNYVELKNALRHAYEHSIDPVLQPHDMPLAVRTFASHDLQPMPTPDIQLDQVLEDYEKSILLKSLESNQNNRAAAARSLGISRPRLLRRLEQLGIDAAPVDTQPADAKSSTVKTPTMKMVGSKSTPGTTDTYSTPKEPESSSKHAPTSTGMEPEGLADIPDPESPIFESIDE